MEEEEESEHCYILNGIAGRIFSGFLKEYKKIVDSNSSDDMKFIEKTVMESRNKEFRQFMIYVLARRKVMGKPLDVVSYFSEKRRYQETS